MCDGCKSQFEQFCSKRFDVLEAGQKEMSDRLFKSNGRRALVTVVEDNAEHIASVTKLIEDHIAITVPVKTVKQFKASLKDGIDIKGYTGSDLMKIALMVAILGYMVWNFHGEKMVKKFVSKEPPAAVE